MRRKKSRFADEMGERYEKKLSRAVLKFYDDGIVRAVIRIREQRSPISSADEFLLYVSYVTLWA